MKVAYFSPLPPDPSGVSDYSAELLPVLARHIQVDVYTEPAHVALDKGLWDGIAVRGYPEFARRQDQYDVAVYHLGCGACAVGPYEVFRGYSGVVVLHDLNLSGLFGALTMGRGHAKRFLLELWHHEGIAASLRATYRFIRTRRMPEPEDFWMNRGVTHRSRGIIVHNAWAKGYLRQKPGRAQVPIWQVNHGVSLPPMPSPAEIQAARQELSLDGYSVVIGSFGVVHESKRFSAILTALCRFLPEVPDAVYLFVGHHEMHHLQQVEAMGLAGRVHLIGRVDMGMFYRYMAATDICVNLRYPAHGEASGPLLRLMSLSKPVAVSNYAQFSELPDEICGKISVGREQEQLTTWLLQLARSPETRRSLGGKARDYVERHHTWEQAAQGYVTAFHEYVNHYGGHDDQR